MTAVRPSGSLRAMTRNQQAPGAAAFVAGLALILLAGIHVTHGTFDDQLTSTVDYLNDGSFSVALICGAIALTGLAAHGAPTRWIRVAGAGQLLVCTGVVAGIAAGESPGWFAVVAIPGLLSWLVGCIALAVWCHRGAVLPTPLAVGIAVLMPTTVILGEFGGSAIAAIVWFALAARWTLAGDARAASPVASAS